MVDDFYMVVFSLVLAAVIYVLASDVPQDDRPLENLFPVCNVVDRF